MSFDVNVLSSKPMIREAASMQNDGGGGNLGYMEQGNQKKKEQAYDESIFKSQEEGDILALSTKAKELEFKEDFSFSKFVAEVIYSIKNLFSRK